MSIPFKSKKQQRLSWRATFEFALGRLWYIPGQFQIARTLGADYALRCVLFHNVAPTESVFTKGLHCTSTPENFEAALNFLSSHYTPVSLQDVLASYEGTELPPRPVLVTFDDSYASANSLAAPLCLKFKIPAIFFINADCLDNRRLALDNLICFFANTLGLDEVNKAIETTCAGEPRVNFLADIFDRFLPMISLATRTKFRKVLVQKLNTSEEDIAARAGLHLSSHGVRKLAEAGFEIGNHTYSHVNCRALSRSEFGEEIDENRRLLEAISAREVRSLSVPYGSSADLTRDLQAHLRRSGYKAVFLAEGRTNPVRADRYQLNRVSTTTGAAATLFSQIEMLPRMRTVKSQLITATGRGNDRALQVKKLKISRRELIDDTD